MPSSEVIFTVKLPIKSVWSFMTDRREVGCLFPGCKGVKLLNDLESIWTLKMSLGPFSKTIEMKARTTEMVEHQHMAWRATHEHLLTGGTVDFRKVSDYETEVMYRLEGHVTDKISFFQNLVVAEKLREVTREFMKAVKERLEWTAGNEG